jgi:hypothetical protein
MRFIAPSLALQSSPEFPKDAAGCWARRIRAREVTACMNTLGVQQFRDIRFESFETFWVPAIRSRAGPVTTTELPRGPRVLATRLDLLHDGRGRAMTILNRIFTTERLLQIIVILAATVAMKLMG